jgi:nucleoid-associated protein YgaU
VRPGDTLSTIARDQGVAGDWQALWANNRATVADPDMIQVGQRLQL